MKRLLPFLSFIALFVFSSGRLNGDGAFDAQINTLKGECKELLGDARFEGSKVTYYTPSPDRQTKNVELFMFLSNEYVFAISGKKVSSSLTVRLYDAEADVPERNLIKEFTAVAGKNISFSSNELNKLYRKNVPEVERLKNLHIEYTIGAGKGTKEAVVLVMGHR